MVSFFGASAQLTGKALQAYVVLSNDDSKDYEQAIFQRYDINEET